MTQVQFPANTWWLTTVCNPSSGVTDALFWPPWVLGKYMVHMHI